MVLLDKYGRSRCPDASVVFTDREEPREVFRQFFERLYKRNVRGEGGNEAPLLYFYGVGGVGKTTLLSKAYKEFVERFGDEIDFVSVCVAHLDLHGLQLGASFPMPEILWKLRNTLVHDHLSTKLFDCVYLLHWEAENPGRKLDLPKSPGRKAISKAIDSYDPIAHHIDQLADSNGLLKFARQCWDEGWRAKRRNEVAKLWADVHPCEWSQQERRERLGQLLWMDIVNSLESNPTLRIALLIDEFERIQTTEPKASDAQTALADLLGALLASDSEAVRQRFCVAIMGRERLRWEMTHDPEWKQLIESHILGGLSERDAKDFLVEKVAPWFRKAGNQKTAKSIIDHQDEILRVTNSANDGEAPSHLPFHLDLVLEVITADPEKFSAELLANEAGHKSKLEDRFLRYLKGHDDKLLKGLQSLALCQSFDRPMFDHLLSERVIVGFAPSDFMQIVGDDHSYVGPNPNMPGYYLFHRQMQQALINSQLKTDEVKAGATERLGKILDYLIPTARFDSPATFSNSHKQSFELGFEVLRGEAAKVLLSPEQISECASRLVESFDCRATPGLLLPFFEWLKKFREHALGVEHRDTLASMNLLAMTLLEMGESGIASELFEKVVPLSERVLGAEDPHTLLSISNWAMALKAQGRLAGARGLLEKVVSISTRTLSEEAEHSLIFMNNLSIVLADEDSAEGLSGLEKLMPLCARILGAEDQTTLTVMNNLACCLLEDGNLTRARMLVEKVLGLRERTLGAENPDTLVSMHDLAHVLLAQGEFRSARQRFEAVLSLRERIQGLEHPETLASMHGLAITLLELGDLVEARDLHAKILSLRERTLGVEHPSTFVSTFSLASAYRKLGDLAGAREWFEKAYLLRTKIPGNSYPDTLTCINKLAMTLAELSEWSEAQILFEKELELSERVLGAEHRDTLACMNNLASTLWCLGDLTGARRLLEKAIPLCERVQGRTSPDTVMAMENLGHVLKAQGNLLDARRLHQRVLSITNRSRKADRPRGR